MKKKRICYVLLFMLLFSCAALSGGCNSQETEKAEEETYTIGVVTKSKDSEYWMSVCSGMENAARDYGVSVLIVSPDTESNDKLQKKMIHDLIGKGVDALAISPIQSYETSGYLERAEKEDIFVVAYDTKIIDGQIPYIGIDNYKAGQELARQMAKRLGNTGQVGIVSGDLGQTTHAERLEGFRTYIESSTDIQIAFVESGYGNMLMREEKIAALMAEHPSVNGIFSTSAVTALGLMDYLKDKPVLIMTVDAQQDALDAVAAGKISALVAQSGYDMGYETVKYIVENRKQESLLHDDILDGEIVTSDNIKEWEEYLPEDK